MVVLFFIAAWITFACSCAKEKKESVLESDTKPAAFPPPENNDGRPIIVAFGNSLTAGSGVDSTQNYPSKLQARINATGHRYKVVNA